MARPSNPDPYDPSRTWASPFFDVLSFLVSHLFLYPVPLAVVAIYYALTGTTVARAVSLACILGYTASLFDGAQFSGKRTWLAFRQPWLGCHSYFPIVRTCIFQGDLFRSGRIA